MNVFSKNRLCITWLFLLALTLISASFAESTDMSKFAIVFICALTAYKGRLVINQLMGLRFATRQLRWLMLGYFYILMPIILTVSFYPHIIRQLTTL